MKSVLPSYTKARHKRNKTLEVRVQKSLAVMPSEALMPYILSNKLKIPHALHRLWLILPSVLKKKLRLISL